MDVEVNCWNPKFWSLFFYPFWLYVIAVLIYCIKDQKMVEKEGLCLIVFLLVTVNFIRLKNDASEEFRRT